MQFQIKEHPNEIAKKRLVYRPAEFSFDMAPSTQGGFASVLINDLNFEINNSGELISIWGMCPYTTWIESELRPPVSKLGSLLLISDKPFLRGASIRLNKQKQLPVVFDKKTGWLQIRDEIRPGVAVEISQGVIVELSQDLRFSALWLNIRDSVESKF